MLLENVIYVVFVLLLLALILAFYRLIKGPSIPDRVIALDLIVMIIAAIIIVYMIFVNKPVFIDAVVVIALITFFGTVSIARYLEKGVEE